MIQSSVSDHDGFALPAELCGDIVHAVGEGVLTYESVFPHRIRFVNPAAEALIGHPIGGIVGRHVDDVLRLARGAGAPDGTLLARLADGVSFESQVTTPWRVEAFPVAFIAARQLAGAGLVVLTFRDIGAEWHARESLRLAEQVFEYSPEAILVTDESGTILRVNPAFTLITGYRPEEAVGRNPRILRSDRHDADFYARLWSGLREEGHWHGEIWDRRKNGEIYPKWLCINAVHLPSGDIRYAVPLPSRPHGLLPEPDGGSSPAPSGPAPGSCAATARARWCGRSMSPKRATAGRGSPATPWSRPTAHGCTPPRPTTAAAEA